LKNAAEKIQVGVGEYYSYLLKWDAWINNRTKSAQASSLLCAKLQEREVKIFERLEFLAKLRSLSVEELKLTIVNGGVIDTAIDE